MLLFIILALRSKPPGPAGDSALRNAGRPRGTIPPSAGQIDTAELRTEFASTSVTWPWADFSTADRHRAATVIVTNCALNGFFQTRRVGSVSTCAGVFRIVALAAFFQVELDTEILRLGTSQLAHLDDHAIRLPLRQLAL